MHVMTDITLMSINYRNQQSCVRFTLRINTMIPDINLAFSPDQFVLNFCSTAKRRCAVDVSPALYAANLPRAVYTP